MKSSFLAVIFFGAGVAACSGTTDKTGAGGDGGQDEVTTSTNSASGTGGAGGSGTGGAAGMGGMGGMGGGGPALKADKLGQTCNVAKVCPMGYLCVYPPATPTAGFCTLPCSGPTDSTTCSALNGFPGPGGGLCNAQIMGQTGLYCGIVCGTQFGIGEECPTGLTCKDLFDATKMGPGMDGKTDTCTP